jgi:hypothetical protein
MTKFVLIIATLLLSLNALASAVAATSFNSIVKKAFQSHSTTAITNTSLVYGGQDISRPLVATADESVWTENRIFA